MNFKGSVEYRVGNFLFGFSSEWLVLCEQNSDALFPKSKLILWLFKKEQQIEEQRERFTLGHKKGKRARSANRSQSLFKGAVSRDV